MKKCLMIQNFSEITSKHRRSISRKWSRLESSVTMSSWHFSPSSSRETSGSTKYTLVNGIISMVCLVRYLRSFYLIWYFRWSAPVSSFKLWRPSLSHILQGSSVLHWTLPGYQTKAVPRWRGQVSPSQCILNSGRVSHSQWNLNSGWVFSNQWNLNSQWSSLSSSVKPQQWLRVSLAVKLQHWPLLKTFSQQKLQLQGRDRDPPLLIQSFCLWSVLYFKIMTYKHYTERKIYKYFLFNLICMAGRTKILKPG